MRSAPVHRQIDYDSFTVELDSYTALLDRGCFVPCSCPKQGSMQVKSQVRQHHFEQIARGLTRRNSQVSVRLCADMHDVVFFVDQDAGRRNLLDYLLMQLASVGRTNVGVV